MYLILTGRIPLPWKQNAVIQIKDFNGNVIPFPTTAAFSLCFSALSMMKAVVNINILRVHVNVSIDRIYQLKR